ncbi:MAG: hypothetical protein ACXAC7_03325 [Candidatus Hodarchaeales archaeon]
MRPSGHLTTSISVIGIYFTLNPNTSWILGLFFLGGAIGIDFDIVFHYVIEEKNHRRYLTHYFPFWLIITFFTYYLNLSTWGFAFGLGICFHLLFDWFDWGLPFIPHSKKAYLTPHFLESPHVDQEMAFFLTYWQNRYTRYLELFFLPFSIISWIYIPVELKFISLLLGLLFIFDLLIGFNNMAKKKNK